MTEVNKHGLPRTIPAAIKREVRQRSKFGCVICRCGYYAYEHIEPTFEEATEHNADAICCLCPTCHHRVTIGMASKKMVWKAYNEIWSADITQVPRPKGLIDLSNGEAHIQIGDLKYGPVETIIRHYGADILKVTPASRDEPAKISARFFNEQGELILEMFENEWIGSLDAWDIEITGRRLSVRMRKGFPCLRLRFEPPGKVVIERMDMRVGNAHFLVTEKSYAVGRYMTGVSMGWAHVGISIEQAAPFAAALEVAHPDNLHALDAQNQFLGGARMATPDRSFVIDSNSGVLIKPFGIAIGSFTGGYNLTSVICGNRELEEMRVGMFSRGIHAGDIIVPVEGARVPPPPP